MRGKPHYKKRILAADRRFNSPIVSKFINMVMRNGKKKVAEKIVYRALEKASEELKKEPLEVLDTVLKNVGPLLEVRPRRIGGANYQVPIEVPPERRITLALRWIIQICRDRQGKSMEEFLAEELVNAYKNQGAAIKKKEDTHKMAEANRAFAHLARF
jgi:small subunit ribosomal protein S7